MDDDFGRADQIAQTAITTMLGMAILLIAIYLGLEVLS